MASIAHELGTPLNVIVGRAQLLLEREGEDEVDEHAKAILRKSEEMIQRLRRQREGASAGEMSVLTCLVDQVIRDVVALFVSSPNPDSSETFPHDSDVDLDLDLELDLDLQIQTETKAERRGDTRTGLASDRPLEALIAERDLFLLLTCLLSELAVNRAPPASQRTTAETTRERPARVRIASACRILSEGDEGLVSGHYVEIELRAPSSPISEATPSLRLARRLVRKAGGRVRWLIDEGGTATVVIHLAMATP